MRSVCLLVVSAILLLGGAARADLRIVGSLPDLAALAAAVGGPHVEVTTLAAPGEDPHFVDPKPSLVLPLHRADLLVVNGLELEGPWLGPLLVQARNARIQPGSPGHFDASTFVEKRAAPASLDRAQGDVHPGGNPHYLLDPRAGARVARALGERMAAIDGEHADVYRANGEKVAAELEQLAAAEAARFRALPAEKRRIVPYHDSLPYLVDWLGLEAVIHVEPKPGISPSPGHVAQVLQRMKQTGARVIVQEAFYPQKTSDTLARLAGGEVVVLSGGTRFAEQTYPERMREIAEKLYAALSR